MAYSHCIGTGPGQVLGTGPAQWLQFPFLSRTSVNTRVFRFQHKSDTNLIQ